MCSQQWLDRRVELGEFGEPVVGKFDGYGLWPQPRLGIVWALLPEFGCNVVGELMIILFQIGKQKAFGRWHGRVVGVAVGVVPVIEGYFEFARFVDQRLCKIGFQIWPCL
jgi:hypothetical protein